VKAFLNGIGESSGDSLATSKNLYLTGNVWYVHYGTGTDAGSPAGKNRLAPLKTLAQAHTNAASDDIIVLLAGHTETLTANQVVNKGLTIVGCGTGTGTGGMPQLKVNAAAAAVLNLQAARISIRNIYFPTSVQSNSVERLYTSGATDLLVKDCYFDCGANDTVAALRVGDNRLRVEGCTFVSVATGSTKPHSAIYIPGAIADILVSDCIFDGGTVGWSTEWAFHATGAATTNLRMQGISLLRDSDIGLHASTTGYVQVSNTTGSGRVVHA
jgi:hypothetical protein